MGIYISLGSNLGERFKQLQRALDALSDGAKAPKPCQVVQVSPCYETAPWGVANQPDFLNMAAEIETAMSPLELLRYIKEVESALGRVDEQRWGPRTIDIDIVLWHALAIRSPELTLPHAAFRERLFVLVPLAAVAPEASDPVTGKTVRELLQALNGKPGQAAGTQRSDIWLYESP